MNTRRNCFLWMLTAVLALGLGLSLFGVNVKAEETKETVSVEYQKCSYDESRKKVIITTDTVDCIVVEKKDHTYTFEDGGWYAITNTNKNTNYDKNYSHLPVVVNGTANLVILDGTYWKFNSGIIVNEDATLNIYPGVKSSSNVSIEGTGEIIASGNSYSAGIGGGGKGNMTEDGNGDDIYEQNKNQNCGHIIIHGGKITARGTNAAGIGSSYFEEENDNNGEGVKNGGTVEIYGGTVNANGSSESAGIGGGKMANGGTVKIYGGTVTAQGGKYGAGIGGGDSDGGGVKNGGYGGDVEIYGGHVTAIGGSETFGKSGQPIPNSGGKGIGVGYDREGSYRLNQDTYNVNPNGSLTVFNDLKVFGGPNPNGESAEDKTADGVAGASGKAYNNERYKYMEIRSDDISYKEWDSSTSTFKDSVRTQGNYNEVVENGTDATIEWNDDWYAVRGDQINLSGKTVKVSKTVNLILCDDKSVTINQLNIAKDATLNVYGQTSGSGSLTANSINDSGNGKLIIHGGNVTGSAKESNSHGVSCDNVTVYGGKLVGQGQGTGMGISGSNLNAGSEVIVRGGKTNVENDLRYVTAQNGTYVRFPYMEVRTGTVPVHTDSNQHKGLSFTIWDLEDRLPTAPGNYYLNRDVTLTATWNVPAGTVKLCLNGNGIKIDSSSSCGVIHVGSGADLTLYDCNAKGHIYTISNNLAQVRKDDYTNTTLYPENDPIPFTGGYITGGKADTGAGVYVDAGGTFTMTGGTILGNKANINGGGLYVGGTFNLSGSALIKGNATGTGESLTADNVYLASGKNITITAALTNTEAIGLTMNTPGVFTSGWSAKMSNADPGECFKYDTPACAVYKDGNELTLKTSEASLTRNNVTTDYAYLSRALAASDNGDTIKLLTDVDTAETLVTTKGAGINDYLTLDLNGYGIRMTGTGSVINVKDGVLDLVDSNPNRTGGSGRPEGVKGGYITGGNAENGGGIYLDPLTGDDVIGHCIMSGGTIIGNTASKDGGGVYANGIFELKGGTITGNTAVGNGGGVYADTSSSGSATLKLFGGTITGNTAVGNGGGIYFEKGKFWLYEGPYTVTGNTAGAQGETNNVYLTEGMRLSIQHSLSSDIRIGLTMEYPGWFTNNLGQVHNDPAQFDPVQFTSDKIEYIPKAEREADNNIQVKLAPAAATVTTGTGNTNSYFTLAEALDHWEDGSSLKLLRDQLETDSTIAISGKKVTLDLNGYGIRMTGSGSVIKVASDADLTLKDSDAAADSHKTHYIKMTNGRGTSVSDTSSDGATQVTGGYITGGSEGGLVNSGTLTMSGGSILGNRTDGTGGGINNSGSLTIKGGTITDNAAEQSGGGIYNSGSLRLSGSSVIKENTAGTGEQTISNNVYLPSGKAISIVGDLTSTSSIGITMETKVGTFTSDSSEDLKASTYKDRFVSDSSDYIVKEEGMELKIHHVHRFTYETGTGQSANQITASCDGTEVCALTDKKVTLTLNAPDSATLTYDGNIKEASVTGYPSDQVENLAAKPDSITYYASTGSKSIEPSGSALNGAPADAGHYVAQISWGEKTASVAFTIEPKEISLLWENTEFAYDGKDHCPTATAGDLITGDSCTVTVTGGQTDANAAGKTYTATAVTLSNSNYKLPAEKARTFTIKKASVDPSGFKTPTAASGLVYNGSDQTLIHAGSVLGGTMYYALTTSDAAPSADSYTTNLPVAGNAGTWYIWYKTDDNHEGVKPASVKVDIGKRKLMVTAKNQTIKEGGSISQDASQYEISGLAAGDTAYVTLVADTSTMQITPSVIIKNGSKDVTVNYELSLARGELTVENTPDKKTTEAQTSDNTPSSVERNLYINNGIRAFQKGKKITVKWGLVPDASMYKVYGSKWGQKMKLIKTIKGGKNTKTSIARLNGRKLNLTEFYELKVIAFARSGGKTTKIAESIDLHVVGVKNKTYTNNTAIKLTRSSFVLKKGKKAKISAKLILADKKKKPIGKAHGLRFRYASSKKSVATVSKGGRITAKKKGTCTIYVYAINGCTRKVKVTVR